MTPSINTARPAAGLEGGVQGMLRGGHALAKGRAKRRGVGHWPRWRWDWSLGRASGGLRRSGGRRWAAAVQVFDVVHDELSALLWNTLQNEVPLVVLQNLLHVLKMLL